MKGNECMSETIRQQVESYVVKKAPKDTSLESVLSTYTKNQLGDLIDANDFSIAKSKKKAEVVEELSDAILNQLSEATSLKDIEVFSTLEDQILPNLPVSLEEWDANEKEAKHVETLVTEGLVLVTADELYVADEVAQKVKEISPVSEAKEQSSDSSEQSKASSQEEKKTVYKSNASSKVIDLQEQKQKRQAFLKKMARKKKKGKKKK